MLLSYSCRKDGVGRAGANLDTFITNKYTGDAKQLLFRMIQSGIKVEGYDLPEFNESELNKILLSIQVVYNSKTTQTDSIFSIAKIHAFPRTNLQYVSMQVDAGTAEGKKLLDHVPTGNIGFDNLFTKYGFSYPGNNSIFPTSAFVEIKAGEAYNLIPLTASFKTYKFIINAQAEGTIGDGNDIIYTVATDRKTADLSFIIGTGDCPAGCTMRTGWRYKITSVGSGYTSAYIGKY